MQCIVGNDFALVSGGPVGKKQTVATFGAGDILTIIQVSASNEYPRMYRILERPKLGLLSRGVLAKFLPEFEAGVVCSEDFGESVVRHRARA